MSKEILTDSPQKTLTFYGGMYSALIPFMVFVLGVIFIALSGAPDEKGFWPVLIFSLGIGLFLAKDKNAFSEIVIEGMSDKLVMIMITAWILASMIGILMTITGFVEALIWIAEAMALKGLGFVLGAFVICCLVSLSTGSSFATILICSPLLYPTGGLLGADLATLAGAIIGGATFGDFIAPISDTTIASALSQHAEIGATVRSRIKYIVPAFLIAFIAYAISAGYSPNELSPQTTSIMGDPKGLPMMLVPGLILFLFLRGKHLLHGLLMGLLFGIALGLGTGLLSLSEVLSLDLENFTAKSFIIDGINRAVGISFFTILLMGLVAMLKASGLIDKLLSYASSRIRSPRQAESWIAATVGGSVLLTTHSIVAILMVAEFAEKTGNSMNISPQRRANILSLIVCIFPFLLPYFIPVILMANTTLSGKEFGVAPVSALETGLHNYIAWALLGISVFVVLLGWGTKSKPQTKSTSHG